MSSVILHLTENLFSGRLFPNWRDHMSYTSSDVRDGAATLEQYYLSKYNGYFFIVDKTFSILKRISIRPGIFSSNQDLLVVINFDPIDGTFYRTASIKVSYLTIAPYNRIELIKFLSTLIDGQILKLEPFVPTALDKELYC